MFYDQRKEGARVPYPKPNDHIAQMADQDEWASDRACRDENPRLFDTIMQNKATLIDEDTETAMDICTECPVMMRCLENAVRFDAQSGVWGGMVYEQRTEWARRHRPEWLPAKRHLALATAA